MRQRRLDLGYTHKNCYGEDQDLSPIWKNGGSGAWFLTKTNTKRIEAAEMWVYRRILGVRWSERSTNESVLKKMGVKLELMGLGARCSHTLAMYAEALGSKGCHLRLPSWQTESRSSSSTLCGLAWRGRGAKL